MAGVSFQISMLVLTKFGLSELEINNIDVFNDRSMRDLGFGMCYCQVLVISPQLPTTLGRRVMLKSYRVFETSSLVGCKHSASSPLRRSALLMGKT
jgi:hypothetical protein